MSEVVKFVQHTRRENHVQIYFKRNAEVEKSKAFASTYKEGADK